MAAGSRVERNPAANLTDDLIVEILSRLPVKSVCRFKCVSKHWGALIADPFHRKKLPQTLAGFFYKNFNRESFSYSRHFINVTGRGPPLIAPSPSSISGYGDVLVVDSCYGMLLCHSRTADAISYVVCNPATEEWVELPLTGRDDDMCMARLRFDPAVCSGFHVFEFAEKELSNGLIFADGLKIYSSRTGEWAHRDIGWGDDVCLCDYFSTAFLNGFLHVFVSDLDRVLVVDTEGKTWRTIAVPDGPDDGFIAQSQGRLYYLNTGEDRDVKLVVYVLEDYATAEWTFKHSVRTSELFGSSIGYPTRLLISFHPDCNRIFYVSLSGLDATIRCYDMDHRRVHLIGGIGCERGPSSRCLPYVPHYLESLAGQN